MDNPSALYTRALAAALADLGHDVRVAEARQNHPFTRTLRAEGSSTARQFYRDFRAFQHHTFEPRAGAPLLEWVSRELALIDIAVAVHGLDAELCRWLANVMRDGLRRAFLTFEPARLTASVAEQLDVARFDALLAPAAPAAALPWSLVPRSIAKEDLAAGLAERAEPDALLASPSDAARALLAALGNV